MIAKRIPAQQIKVVVASGGQWEDAWSAPVAVSHDEVKLRAWIDRAEAEQNRKIKAQKELHQWDRGWRLANPEPEWIRVDELPRPTMDRWHGVKVSKMDEATKAMHQADLDRIRFVREENARRREEARKPVMAWNEIHSAAKEKFKAELLKKFSLDEWPEYGNLDTKWNIHLIEYLPE